MNFKKNLGRNHQQEEPQLPEYIQKLFSAILSIKIPQNIGI